MPTFEENSRLTESGDVCVLLTVSGGGEVWRYASCDSDLVDDAGNAYAAVPLTTGNVKADGAMTGAQIDVVLPRQVPLADRFFPVASRTIYFVRISQASHAGGVIQDHKPMFRGTVIAAAVSGDDGELLRLKLTTHMGLLERSGLRRRYQLQCPYVLYGPECRASKPDAIFQANISAPPSTSFADVYVVVHGGNPDQPWMWRGRDLRVRNNRMFMIGATVMFGGQSYEVVDLGDGSNSIGVRIRPDQVAALREAVLAAAPNDRVCQVVPNCDHTLACCNDLFRNGPNYGGQPWIPYENPVKSMFVGK